MNVKEEQFNRELNTLLYENESGTEFDKNIELMIRRYNIKLKLIILYLNFFTLGIIFYLKYFADFKHPIVEITFLVSVSTTFLSLSLNFFKIIQFDIVEYIVLNLILCIPFQIISGILSTKFSNSGDPVIIVFSIEIMIKYIIIIIFNYSFKSNFFSSMVNILYIWISLFYFHHKLNWTLISYLTINTITNIGTIFLSYYIEKSNRNLYIISSFFRKERSNFLELLDDNNIGYFIVFKGKIVVYNNFMNSIFKLIFLDKNQNLNSNIYNLLFNIKIIDDSLPLEIIKILKISHQSYLENTEEKSSFKFDEFETLISKNAKIFENFKTLGNIFLDKSVLQISLRFKNKLEFLIKDITHISDHECQKAENKFNDLYLAKIAHEFKNPMLNIIDLCKLIGNLNNIELILNLSEYLLFLIEDLEYYSEIKKKNKEIQNFDENHPECLVEINPTMQFCLDIFKIRQENDILKQNISFILDIEDDLPDLLISEIRLKQVIINLLSNSYKFTLNGYIRLSVRRINSDENDCLRFSVEDSGLGISAKNQSELFNFKNETCGIFEKQNSNSSGFGLQIVHHILNSFNSKINFISNELSGSKFWFDLKYHSIYFEKGRSLKSPQNTIKLKNLELSLTNSQKNTIYPQIEQENHLNSQSNFYDKESLNNYFIKDINSDLDSTIPLIKSTNIIICDDEEFTRIAHIKLFKHLERSLNMTFNIIEARNGLEVFWQIYQSVMSGYNISGILIDENMPFLKGSKCICLIKLMISEHQINKIILCSATSYSDNESVQGILMQGADLIMNKPLKAENLRLFVDLIKNSM